MNDGRVTVAIPTFDNPVMLIDTLVSLTRNTDFTGRIIVVNNGSVSYEQVQGAVPYDIDWIDAGENLGWARGINRALAEADTELFCMMNDDLVFPPDRRFWEKLTSWFAPEFQSCANVGGSGVTSNYIFGYQNVALHGMPDSFSAPLLIGMLAVYRRSLLADGLDGSLPGGDDFDLSIRVRDAGYHLVVDRRCYVHHHGSATGRRIHGNYWDSAEHQVATYNAIIRKHSVSKWYGCLNGKIHALSGDFRIQQVTLGDAYHRVLTEESDVREHAGTLRLLAECCPHITEFGTDDGTTATVFLSAKPESLTCYDINRTPEIDWLEKNANGTRFIFHQQSTVEVEIEPTDLLFIDDLHTYAQVTKELEMHSAKVRRYIAFHDTELCGQRGEDRSVPGLRAAIAEFMRERPEWRLVHSVDYNNGLIVIARVA